MICYKDKTWCNAHKCTYYTVCKEALPYAKKMQQKQEGCQWLPYAVRDMSDDCNDYEVEGQNEKNITAAGKEMQK